MVRREYQVRLVIAEGKEYVGIDGEKVAKDWLGGVQMAGQQRLTMGD